eukprot:TRINITY_DN133_c0_g1_i13.p1 TRINITY_DN133_c0_g1~~TRINITY_DN133_c0_g1_i13.p1  ORF type:complete len:285 (+),score=66.94 TRINITY_DN133_c0_g1_i13:35-889(+)
MTFYQTCLILTLSVMLCQAQSICQYYTSRTTCTSRGCKWNYDNSKCIDPSVATCYDSKTSALCENSLAVSSGCRWSSSKCIISTSCTYLTNTTICALSSLSCKYDTSKSTCVTKSTVICSDSTTQSACGSSLASGGCKWDLDNNQCVGKSVAICSDYTISTCSSASVSGGCKWNPDLPRCIKSSTDMCFDMKSMQTCLASTIDGGCKWGTTCSVAKATTCPELFNPTTCSGSSIGCKWNPETMKCIGNTTAICFDSKTSDKCIQSTISGGCKWNSTACASHNMP